MVRKKVKNERPPVDKKYKPPPYVTGRPTKYKPEYCDALYQHMGLGLSYETFGVTIGVSVQTCYDWEKKHPEFIEAKKKAFMACQLYWEMQGRSGMRSKAFNATVWIYNMKNRFRKSDTWGFSPEEQPTFNFNLSYDPKELKDE